MKFALELLIEQEQRHEHKTLATKIEYFDNYYRRGKTQIRDTEFDELVNQLKAR